MLRTFAIAAAYAALAVPAAADTSVTVNIAGLDYQAAHAKIVRGAELACFREFAGESTLMLYYERPVCVSDAIARAESSASTAQAGPALSQRRLARR